MNSAKNLFLFLLLFSSLANALAQNNDGLSAAPEQLNIPAPNVKGEYAVNEEYNVKLKLPGDPFKKNLPDKKNAAAIFAFTATNPRIFFQVYAYKSLEFVFSTSADTADSVIREMAPNFGEITKPEKKPYSINSMDGFLITFTQKAAAAETHIVLWLYSARGYCYNLFCYSEALDRDKLTELSLKLFADFSQIDPGQNPFQKTEAPIGTYDSAEYGLRLDLANTPWRHWTQLEQSLSGHGIAGVWGREGCFIICPLVLFTDLPAEDVLLKELLALPGLEYSRSTIKKVEEIKEGGLAGRRILIEGPTLGDSSVFDIKILWNDSIIYMILVGAKDKTALGRMGEAIFPSLAINPPPKKGIDEFSASYFEKTFHGKWYTAVGNTYFRDQHYRESVPFFSAAFQLDSGNPEILIDLLDAYHKLGRYPEGMAVASRHFQRLSFFLRLHGWYAWFLEKTGQSEEAIVVYNKLFSNPYHDDEIFLNYLSLLSRLGRWDDCKKSYDQYAKSFPSASLALEFAKLLYNKGDYAAAKMVLESGTGIKAFHLESVYWLLYTYRELNEYAKGLDLCNAALDKGIKNGSVYYLKAQMEYGQGDYLEAKASLQKALALDPDNRGMKEMLDFVSAKLGQGNNAAVREEIAPVDVPGFIRDKMKKTEPDPALGTKYGAWISFEVTGYSWHLKAPLKKTFYQSVKVIDESGVAAFSTLSRTFDPLREKIYVNSLAVYGENGELIASGNPDNYYLVDEKSELATYNKTLIIPVPNLRPGCTIEWSITEVTRTPVTRFLFERHFLSHEKPVAYGAIYIEGDIDTVEIVASHAPQPVRTAGLLCLEYSRPTQYVREPWPARYEDYLPLILVGDKGGDWETPAKEYLAGIQDRLSVDEETRQLAYQLARDALTEEEKTERILRYVQENYVYKGIEFGVRSSVPNKAGRIIANKYGDCKDLSLLLFLLLHSAGIECSLALIHSWYDVNPVLPSLDQFNHMIVYIPGYRGGQFADVTVKGIDMRLSVPYGLAGKQALVLDPGKPVFRTLPGYDFRSNRVIVDKTQELSDGTDLRIREKVMFYGYYAGGMRDDLRNITAAEYKNYFQNFLSRLARGIIIKDVAIDNLSDTSGPLTLSIEYTVKSTARAADSTAGVKNTLLWEKLLLAIEHCDSRLSPFSVSIPVMFESIERLKKQPGSLLDSPIPADIKGKNKFGEWNVSFIDLPDTLTIKCSFTMFPNTYPSSDYPEFIATFEKVMETLEADFRFKKTDSEH
jgi:tetratricopeptide (TPR) repeat protein